MIVFHSIFYSCNFRYLAMQVIDRCGCSVDNDPDRYREEVWGHRLIEQPHLRNLIECGLGVNEDARRVPRVRQGRMGEMNCHVGSQ
jgi:hypothetical protein